MVILPSSVPQGCVGGGEVINFPPRLTFKNHVRSTQNIVRKISNLVSIASFPYQRKEKNRLLSCSGDKGKRFPKYRYVGQSRLTHVVVVVFPVRFIEVVTV